MYLYSVTALNFLNGNLLQVFGEDVGAVFQCAEFHPDGPNQRLSAIMTTQEDTAKSMLRAQPILLLNKEFLIHFVRIYGIIA